jgi:hypothetical protein
MLRLICGLAALGASLLLALPASAEPARTLSGALVSVSPTHVKVKGEHAAIRCAVGEHSPSVAGFSNGDRVQVACTLRRAGGFVLTRIRLLHPLAGADTSPGTGAGTGTATEQKVEFAGAITSLSSTAISLHDGDRDLTCSISAASPARGEAKLGDHARVTCTGGVLTSFALIVRTDPTPPAPPNEPAPPAPTPTPAPAPTPAVVAYGLITALDTASLTIHNAEHGDLTCTLGEHSPRLGDYHVGDRVKLGCTDGRVLVSISRY